MASPLELYIGIMSGTSLDGIDAVLMATNGHQAQLTASTTRPFAKALRQRLLDVANGTPISAQLWGELDAELGQAYAEIVLQLLQESGTQANQVRAIGCHGQTLWHQPYGDLPFSLQLGDGNRVAALTGIITINDFRRKDMALGGQGAPLVPAFHQQVLADTKQLRIVVNIGGIANITVLDPQQPVQGFDVGPGNMLLDAWCQQQWGQPFDKGAAFGLQGQVNSDLLARLLDEPWLALPAPKSTGRELFSPHWLAAHLQEHQAQCGAINALDVQATLTEFSASAIVDQVTGYATKPTTATQTMPTGQLLVCGGGGHNPLLMQRLTALLPNWQVTTTNSAGVDMDAMEAMAFAWLAHQTLHGLPGNLPAVTGASRPAILGAIHLP
ncbi:anhydro-N-acetylmuramic acid kinase [Oceanisphaera profunda]|uniref:Anhydro-N-acetylmuramic acid kinase n=1 Tax=Oceanisphaera profunda TaxID=1416627 RepID=A0A1Y0D5Y8_9GAMM|nr:anhydro-N-acetylmuramic acid kinase [Oceanisphaera profunda]ART82617.1 anhydro-N-acetylmuramic acid kinase [Oceanisphaera profunda]